jgi:hypothetical protein
MRRRGRRLPFLPFALSSSLHAHTMRFLLLAALAASATATQPFLHSSQLLEDVPAFPRGLYGQLKAAEENAARMVREEAEAGGEGQMVFKAPVKPTYEAHTFEQRVDHNGSPTSLSSAGTFKQRYVRRLSSRRLGIRC